MILDLKDGKLWDSGKQEEDKTFHKLHVLGMNDDLWDRVRGLGSENLLPATKVFWERCEMQTELGHAYLAEESFIDCGFFLIIDSKLALMKKTTAMLA